MKQASRSGQGGPAQVKITTGTEDDLPAIVGVLDYTAENSIARFATRPASVANDARQELVSVGDGDGYGIENDQGERVFKVDGKASGPRKLDDRSSKRSSFASEPPRARPSRLSDDAPRNAGRPARGERKMGPALAIGGDA